MKVINDMKLFNSNNEKINKLYAISFGKKN